MVREKEIVEKAALSDGGHIITGAQSIFEAPDPDKVRFDLNENLFGASPKVCEAITDFVSNVGVNWYNAWMRSQCAESIAKYVGVKPTNVFVCNGSAETLVVLAEIFLEPGDELVTFYPTYRVLLSYAKVYGSHVVKVPHEKDFKADRLPGKVVDEITPKTKIIYMCNPTTFGAKVPKREIIKVLESSQKKPKPLVIVDEAYFDSATYPFSNETVADLVEEYDNLVVARTFSKSFALAGLRIGYAVSCQRNIEACNKFFSPLGVSSIAYVGAMAALEDLNYYEEARKQLELNRKYLVEELTKLGIEVFPSCANFFLARFPEGVLNDNGGKKGVWTRLIEEGIYLRNKSVMYPDTDLCLDMVRITVGKKDGCERLINSLKRILAEL